LNRHSLRRALAPWQSTESCARERAHSPVFAGALSLSRGREEGKQPLRNFDLRLGVLDVRGTCFMDCRVASILAMTGTRTTRGFCALLPALRLQ
jgi:hypothetical protein